MSVIKILIIFAAIVISGFIFLSLPAQYQINIQSQQYYEKCANLRVDKSLCEPRKVPAQVIRNESLLTAWWTVTEISRALPLKYVEAQWGPDASKMIIKNAIISLLPIAAAIGFALFPRHRKT